MDRADDRIQELARKWLMDTITIEDRAEFMHWYNNADDGEPLIISEEFATDELLHGLRIYKNIYEKNKDLRAGERHSSPDRRLHFLKIRWKRYAAAIIIVLGMTYLFNSPPTKRAGTARTYPVAVPNDVTPPTSAHAVITLADGRDIVLDSVGSGLITTQGHVKLAKLSDGRLVYKGTSKETIYNTLRNPRGSKIVEMTLTDGTRVWL